MTDTGLLYRATFTLSVEFCHKKKLEFALDQYTLDMFSMFPGNNYNTYFASSEEESSYVCVRHPFIPSTASLPQALSQEFMPFPSKDVKVSNTYIKSEIFTRYLILLFW